MLRREETPHSETLATAFGEAQIEALQSLRSHCAEKIRECEAELTKHKEDDRWAASMLELLNQPTSARPTSGRPTGARPLTSRAETCDLVEEILREKGPEMHYRDIYEEVAAHGFEILGKDPGNSLLSRICGDSRFMRVAAGTYQLTAPVNHSAPPTAEAAPRP